MNIYDSLPKEEVIKAIERRNPCRVPLIRSKWWGEGLEEQYGARLREFDRYPEDVVEYEVNPLDVEKMGLSWEIKTDGPHDARIVLDDWAKLDEFIEKLPDPENDGQIDALIPRAEQAQAQNRYGNLFMWRLFFERPWGLRGMQNMLMDYYLYPNEVHRLHDALCQLYERYIRVGVAKLKPDGFWTSDDLGHQNSLFMRPETFREFIKPYYRRIGNLLQENNLHWWLHSCGDNTSVLEDLIEVGVNVFHPVQKGTMDEALVAREYGDRITFLAGFDVQHILQEADPDGVREEVRFLIDTFDRSDGGMCLASGNGIVSGTPINNIAAFLDEALIYGVAHREKYQSQKD